MYSVLHEMDGIINGEKSAARQFEFSDQEVKTKKARLFRNKRATSLLCLFNIRAR